MGTILNSCKETRKKIREVEEGINNAVVAWKVLDDNRKEIAAYFPEKCYAIKNRVIELKGKLEIISGELEKDSGVRPYYNEVYNKCVDFLNSISKK